MVKEFDNEPTMEGNSSATGDGNTGTAGGPKATFTPEQLARKVKCQTREGEIEVPWHLMMQSKAFMNMWGSLYGEDSVDQKSFIFPLNDITAVCFGKIVEWLAEHDGKPEPEVQEEPLTGERIWFTLTEWEKEFFKIDFEQLKEFFLAANFLDIRSLYLYCAQECARHIMDKSPEEIREMLCLPDDLTEEEKDGIRTELEVTNQQPNPAANGGNGQQAAAPVANGNDGQPPVANGNGAGQPAADGNDAGQPAADGNDAGQPAANENDGQAPVVNGKDAVKGKDL